MNPLDTTSYWLDSAPPPPQPSPSRSIQVDVIVVGAGITGITAAYLLKKAGRTVALMDRGRCLHGETGHTTAHLTCVTDTRLTELASDFNEEVAKMVWDGGAAAIDQIVKLIRAEEIDCDFKWVSGFLHEPLDSEVGSDADSLKKEASLATKLGFAAEYLDAIPAFGRAGVRFPHQALFHPLKYLEELLRKIPGSGSHVFENAPVDVGSESPLTVRIGDAVIRGSYLVLATHNPPMGKEGALAGALFQGKLALYQTYAISATIPRGVITEALFWDTKEPYDYLRVERRAEQDFAIFGGEDHKTGQAEDTAEPFRRLEERLLALIPSAVVNHRWSGQVIETIDGLPYIGEINPQQFVATGCAGNGMTFGTLAAMMSVDASLKRPNPWRELFDPHRKKYRRRGNW